MDFSTQQQATDEQKKGQRYLIDETTAVVRFIFPCKENEAEVIQFMFEELFMSTMTEQISGEDEVWVVETGIRTRPAFAGRSVATTSAAYSSPSPGWKRFSPIRM